MLKLIFTTLMLSVILSMSHAQKLPNKQEISVYAPVNIKIDGKVIEWGSKFQAYNNTSRIYYTIANDDKNLYFIGRMDGVYGNEKALRGGITFTIRSLEAEKNKLKDISVTFPTQSDHRKTEAITDNSYAYRGLGNDTITNKKKIDSLRVNTNKRMDNLFKEIGIVGIKDVQEPLISVYNELDIKASAQFDNKMRYTYELAIPLKYLGVSVNSVQTFKYNIKLNGVPEKDLNGNTGVRFPDPTFGMSADNKYANFATDFSDEYILAKKP